MEPAHGEALARLMEHDAPAARAVLLRRVRSMVADALPGAAELLDASMELDWTHPDRRAAHLATTTACVEEWMDRGDVEIAIAVQQVVALCDPKVVSPGTLIAAAVETASYAHAVITTGAHDGEAAAGWERETVDALLTLT